MRGVSSCRSDPAAPRDAVPNSVAARCRIVDTEAMVTRWDGWSIDVPARTLAGPDGAVHVEPQVFDVLAYLIDHRDRVVRKDELLEEIWGTRFVSESALTSRIKYARRAIGDDGRAQKYIRNVHGRGYRFVGEILSEPTHRNVDVISEAERTPELALSIGLDDEFDFVGRELELDAARQRLDGGTGGVLFFGGEPGIGKSRLAVHLLDTLSRAGARVCAGRSEEHVSAPLQPVRDGITQLAASHPVRFTSWAQGVERELAGLVPALMPRLAVDPRPVDGYAAAEVLSTVLERASEHSGLFLLIDDVHWSDEPTRAFISRLGRRSTDNRVSVVCTFRTTAGDLPPDVARWIATECRRPRSLRIDLGGLDHSAAKALVDSVLVERPSDVAETLIVQTDGHGLLLTESLRDILRGGSSVSSVAQIVGTRLDRLPESVRKLVRAGAFLGPEFPFGVASLAAGLEPARALSAIEVAIEAGLLHESLSPERFRFSHQLVPQTIRESMSRAASARIHHGCLTALRAHDASPIEIGHHLVGAIPLVPLTEAIEQSREIASRATELKAFDSAIRLLESCLAVPDLPPRTVAELSLQLGSAGNAAGRAVSMASRFEAAAELARTHGWVDVLVEAALGHYGSSPYRNLHDRSTLELLAEADLALGDAPSPDKARVLAKTAAFSQFRMPLSLGDDMTARALEMGAEAAPRVRIELLEYRAIVFSNPAGCAELDVLDPELERLRDAHGIYAADAAVPETRLLARGRGDALRLEARSDNARIRSQPIAEWRDLTLHSTLCAFAGDLQRARTLCDEAGSIGCQFWGDSAPYLHALGQVFIAALGGGWDRAIDLLDRLLELHDNQVLVLHAAWAHLAGGSQQTALTLLERIRLDDLCLHHEHILGGNALVAAAEVALLSRDADLMRDADRHLRPFADMMLGVPWACSLAAADPLSRLAEAGGERLAANAYRAAAEALYRGLDAPALLARLS